MTTLEIIILSIIEGLTEFLPISSTGHLILTSALLGISENQFVQSFNIVIQFGAILSVLVVYRERILKASHHFILQVLAAFVPTAVIGFLLKDVFESMLGSVITVAVTLILGGFVLIWVDRWKKTTTSLEEFSIKRCFAVGALQCLALIPGVSRAGATIVGAMALGMKQKDATEFSFFLAVPTLAAASLYKFLKLLKAGSLSNDQGFALFMGFILSFVFAYMAIKFFIQLVSRYGFKHFGYYRIALGILILIVISY